MSIVNLLGWSILHFLWQGLAIAAACQALFFLMQSVRARYAIGYAGLLLMLAAPLATFFVLQRQSEVGQVTSSIFITAADDSAIISRAGSTPSPSSPTTDANSWHDSLALATPWLGRGWIMGAGLIALWNAIGFVQLARIRNHSKAIADRTWLARRGRLSDQLGLRCAIPLLLTDRVHIPGVVGAFKPAILWPAAALTGLTPIQIEALLAHEMAHIRRYDHWANLLQVGIETVLFFHPCVWWLSRRVRQEREHCCDDIAAGVVQDRIAYADALVAMASLHHTPLQSYSLSLHANGGSLMKRVQRLLEPTRHHVRGTRHTLVSLVLCALLACASWAAQTTQPRPIDSETLKRLAQSDPRIGSLFGHQAELKERIVQTETRGAAEQLKALKRQLELTTQLLDRDARLILDGTFDDQARINELRELYLQRDDLVIVLDQSRHGRDANAGLTIAFQTRLIELNERIAVYHISNPWPRELALSGEVPRAGVYSLTDGGITLKQLLISAGLEKEAPRVIRVLRALPENLGVQPEETRWPDLLQKRLGERGGDFYLHPNDVIEVRNPNDPAAPVVPPATQPGIQPAAEGVGIIDEARLARIEPFFARLIEERNRSKIELLRLGKLMGPNAPQILQLRQQVELLEKNIHEMATAIEKELDGMDPSTTQPTTETDTKLKQLQVLGRQRQGILIAIEKKKNDAASDPLPMEYLEQFLRATEFEMASIISQPGEYYIGGRIERPGVYAMTARGITLTQAMIAAGRIETNGDIHIDVIRRSGPDQEEIIRRNWNDLLSKPLGDERGDLFLQPDDQIMVGVKAARARPTTSPTTAP